MEVYIISGSSKGLGQALSKRLYKSGNCVFGLSRNKGGTQGSHIVCDLANPDQIESAMDSIFTKINLNSMSSICLINNAADLSPIAPLDCAKASEIDESLRINLSAPAMLSSIFIRKTLSFSGDKKIINITSKSAEKPFFGLSLYCMAKAGLEQLTRCIALEQEARKFPVMIISVDPGSMDTGMQETIRATSKDQFPYADHFKARYENGVLYSSESVADFVVACINMDHLENGGRYAFADQQ